MTKRDSDLPSVPTVQVIERMFMLMNVLASLFGYHAGNIVGFGGIGARTVIKDWSYTARTGKYSVKNSLHDFEKNLKSISPKALAISFSNFSSMARVMFFMLHRICGAV